MKDTQMKNSQLVGIDFPNMPWERWQKPGAEGRVKMMFVGDKRIRILELPAGFREENWCEKGHVGYVLQGQFTIEFRNHEVACGPGMGFVIPDGDPHRSRGLPGDPTTVFVVDDASPAAA